MRLEAVMAGGEWHVVLPERRRRAERRRVGTIENRRGRLLWYMDESDDWGWADMIDDCLKAMEEVAL